MNQNDPQLRLTTFETNTTHISMYLYWYVYQVCIPDHLLLVYVVFPEGKAGVKAVVRV
jgi:hypothetical protein